MGFASANLPLKVSFSVRLALAKPMPFKVSDTRLKRRRELNAISENINVLRLCAVKNKVAMFDLNLKNTSVSSSPHAQFAFMYFYELLTQGAQSFEFA